MELVDRSVLFAVSQPSMSCVSPEWACVASAPWHPLAAFFVLFERVRVKAGLALSVNRHSAGFTAREVFQGNRESISGTNLLVGSLAGFCLLRPLFFFEKIRIFVGVQVGSRFRTSDTQMQ